MAEQAYQYIIIGGGLAGAAAVTGIRAVDANGSILLLGAETHAPYHRPPLSKQLWTGKTTVEKLPVKKEAYYQDNGVELVLGRKVVGLDAEGHTVADDQGQAYRYGKLLLATGGAPRTLTIPGSGLPGIFYYRTLNHYLALREVVAQAKSALVIGGGFIGAEMAAALQMSGLKVTMIYPDPYLVARVFPEGLGRALQEQYRSRGITIHSEDTPATLMKTSKGMVALTQKGKMASADLVVVGAGITPSVELAEAAGLQVGNGVVVNANLQTSHPDIYAAGDNANFPYAVLGQQMRIEHWDNALNQGKAAGRNMAGADEPFLYMPFFYSDMFEFGFEAVGEVDARLETVADWQKEFDTGVIYYLKDGKVRGAMMCNVWDKVDAARALIQQGAQVTGRELQGAIA
ncbi:MAG: NAD(P)/FAD-dependent oxidoreductase [Armatimonadota bacterium]